MPLYIFNLIDINNIVNLRKQILCVVSSSRLNEFRNFIFRKIWEFIKYTCTQIYVLALETA